MAGWYDPLKVPFSRDPMEDIFLTGKRVASSLDDMAINTKNAITEDEILKNLSRRGSVMRAPATTGIAKQSVAKSVAGKVLGPISIASMLLGNAREADARGLSFAQKHPGGIDFNFLDSITGTNALPGVGVPASKSPQVVAPMVTKPTQGKPKQTAAAGQAQTSKSVQSGPVGSEMDVPQNTAAPDLSEGQGYGNVFGLPAAMQAEQKKQGNMDALIIALGDIGASLMGPYQDSWQAQIGKTASGLARQRVFSTAMESALAGQVPDQTGLALLTPEQQVQVSQAMNQQREMSLKERSTATGEKQAETAATEVKQAGKTREAELGMEQDKLNFALKKWDTEKKLAEAQTIAETAQAELYRSTAKKALEQANVTDDKTKKDATDFALKYVKDTMDETASMEDKTAAFNAALDAYINNKLPITNAPKATTPKAKYNPTTGKFEL